MRRPKKIVDLLKEVCVELESFGAGNGDAFLDHQFFERSKLRVRDAADIGTEDRGNRIHDAVDDEFTPDIRADARRNGAFQTSRIEHTRNRKTPVMLFDQGPTSGHELDDARLLENRSELRDPAQNDSVICDRLPCDLLAS